MNFSLPIEPYNPERARAIRQKLMGPAPQAKRPALTLVKTEQIVVRKNVGGRPRNPKPRPDANEHVRDYRLHMFSQREILTPRDYVKMRCLQERVDFEVLLGTARQQGIVEFRWALCVEVKERWPNLSSPPRHQICKEKVEEILRLVSEGTSKREAARLVGISEETVRRIVIPGYRERRNEQNRRRKAV